MTPRGPEEDAREKIDEKLKRAGWDVQHREDVNLAAAVFLGLAGPAS